MIDIIKRVEKLEREIRTKNVRGVIDSIDPEMGSGGCVRVSYGDNQLSGWLPVKPTRSGSIKVTAKDGNFLNGLIAKTIDMVTHIHKVGNPFTKEPEK